MIYLQVNTQTANLTYSCDNQNGRYVIPKLSKIQYEPFFPKTPLNLMARLHYQRRTLVRTQTWIPVLERNRG